MARVVIRVPPPSGGEDAAACQAAWAAWAAWNESLRGRKRRKRPVDALALVRPFAKKDRAFWSRAALVQDALEREEAAHREMLGLD